jgi:chorismate synthase
VEISGYVKEVCGVRDEGEYPFEVLESAKSQPLFMLDSAVQDRAKNVIDTLKAEGDTAGGVIEVRVSGLKSGFGSCMQYDKKLDARLCGALMSVQAIKGVEVGLGFKTASLKGSQVHDEIFYDGKKFYRNTNNAGGIEGGMSNGGEIVLRAVMKPIPTLMKGLNTVDYLTHEKVKAASERSDVSAICAAEIILESVTAFTLAEVVAERLGGDNMREVLQRYKEL